MFGLFGKKIHKQKSSSPTNTNPSQLLPRIKNIEMINHLKSQGIPEDQMPLYEPLVGDLIVSYAFDSPEMFRLASKSEIQQLGLHPDDIRSLALSNMKKIVPEMSAEMMGPFVQIQTGNELEACSLLGDGLWNQMKERTEGDLIVACPHKLLVLFFSSTSEPAMAFIPEFMAKVLDDDPTHFLSKHLYKWDGAWSVYKENII